jgi:protein-S-isoprenylcysteine O-methyltransferase Ste14
MQAVTTGVAWGCFYVFIVAWVVAALYFSGKRPSKPGEWSRRLRRSWPARLALIMGVIVIGIASSRSGVWRHLQYWQPVLAIIGAVLAVASTALLLWARWVLGSMWASVPMVQERHELRTEGPYGLVRHPIYTGLLGLVLGGMLASGFGVWVLFFVVSVPLLAHRVRVEDKLMAEQFGEQYAAYRQRVPALIPLPRRPR